VGPQPCECLILGESAGWDEDKRGVPFTGKSGADLNYVYLPMAGLTRDLDVRITNAMLCVPTTTDGRPEPDHLRACAKHHLPAELARTNPRCVVTVGAMALSLFGEHTLELEHGLPIDDQYYGGWSGTVFPAYHPAAALRDPQRYMTRCIDDFRALGRWRKGELERPEDQWPEPDYRELHSPPELEAALAAPPGPSGNAVAVDTETDLGRPWCMTFSRAPGTGYMIHAGNRALLMEFARWAERNRPLFLVHNWLFDAPVLRALGIEGFEFTDTMQQAYTLGTDQALKTLAYRLCGMRMQDYDDLVAPHARAAAVDYLRTAAATVIEEHVSTLPWKVAKRSCSGGRKYGGKHLSCPVWFDSPEEPEACIACGRVLKAPRMERDKGGRQYVWDRARRILIDAEERNADPMARWALIPAEERAPMEAIIGGMPRPSIAQVPREDAVRYAARDADATIRIKPELDAMSMAMSAAHMGAV
jgi:uracil-DNA glycosylase family 4